MQPERRSLALVTSALEYSKRVLTLGSRDTRRPRILNDPERSHV